MFLVGCFGDWVRAASVLFEPGCVHWDTPARVKTRQGVAGAAERNFGVAEGQLSFDKSDGGNGSCGSCVDGFNFEMFSGECKSVSPTLQRERASDTLAYGNDVFWNGNDYAESLTCTSHNQLMPDKSRLECIIQCDQRHLGFPCETEICNTIIATDYKEPQNLCCETQQESKGAFCGVSLYNQEETGDVACTVTSQTGTSVTHSGPSVIVKNFVPFDSFSVDGHPTKPASKRECVAEICPTSDAHYPGKLNNQDVGKLICYENYANDSRITESSDVSPLLSSRCGTGGGNLPLVQECHSLKIRAGKEGGGKGALVQKDLSATLSCNNDQTLFVVHGAQTPINNSEHANALGCCNNGLENCVCYAVDAVNSNSMKSKNPHSGFHQEDIAKTLDTTEPNPTKNQGGNVVICATGFRYRNGSKAGNIGWQNGNCCTLGTDENAAVAIAENVIGRADHNGGNGVGAQEELAYTQNATGVMGVCTKGNGDAFESDVHTTISASGGGQAGQGYPCARIGSTVRRLLPVECERLMGFPDGHTKIAWKGKSVDDCPDAPRYKACGNSMCVNCMEWIGRQIDAIEKEN